MSIRVEETPNPSTIKFFLNKMLTDGNGIYYANLEESKNAPFVEFLFMISGIKAIFLGADFISITKFDEAEWEVLKPEIILNIMDYLSSGKEIFHVIQKKNDEEDHEGLDFNDPIVQEIYQLIEDRVRPAVMQDGGNVVFKHFRDGVVYLKLQGACSGCPSAALTLKSGIKNILQYYIEAVKDVEAVE